VKILRARPTRHFLYLLVRCRCGKRFGHRADRRMIVCYHCGRIADLAAIRRRRPRKPKPSKPARSSVTTKTRRVATRAAHRRARKSSAPAS
jgi:hypothetical protein